MIIVRVCNILWQHPTTTNKGFSNALTFCKTCRTMIFFTTQHSVFASFEETEKKEEEQEARVSLC